MHPFGKLARSFSICADSKGVSKGNLVENFFSRALNVAQKKLISHSIWLVLIVCSWTTFLGTDYVIYITSYFSFSLFNAEKQINIRLIYQGDSVDISLNSNLNKNLRSADGIEQAFSYFVGYYNRSSLVCLFFPSFKTLPTK